MPVRRRRLSEHFDLGEFDSKDGVLVPVNREDDIYHLVEWWLVPLRARFGQVTVHSGFRTEIHNEAVGGARNSVHLLSTHLPQRRPGSSLHAAAADVTCATGNPRAWAKWALEHRTTHPHLARRGRGGVGVYPSFVHLDTAGHRGWGSVS